jgi:hypothetical protein
LLPDLLRSVGLGPVSVPPKNGPLPGGIDGGTLPVDVARVVEAAQQFGVDSGPGAVALPVAQAPPAGHSAAATHPLGQVLPSAVTAVPHGCFLRPPVAYGGSAR